MKKDYTLLALIIYGLAIISIIAFAVYKSKNQ